GAGEGGGAFSGQEGSGQRRQWCEPQVGRHPSPKPSPEAGRRHGERHDHREHEQRRGGIHRRSPGGRSRRPIWSTPKDPNGTKPRKTERRARASTPAARCQPPAALRASGSPGRATVRTSTRNKSAPVNMPPATTTAAPPHWPRSIDAVSRSHFAAKPPLGGTPMSVSPLIPNANTVIGRARPTPAKSAMRS